MDNFLIILVIGAIVALLVWIGIQKRGIHIEVDTPSPPEHVRAAVVSVMGRKRSWAVVADGGTTISYQFKTKPNILIAFILLWFFLIPGIIYLVVGGQNETFTASVFETGASESTRRVQLVANGAQGRKLAKKVRSQLAVVA